MRFDHVGVAARDAADLAALFADLLEARIAHEETFDGMRVVFLELDDGGFFELLEPAAEGTIREYLDREGPGIHHVALATDDLPAALERARDLGVDLVDDTPRPGAWGHEVAFLHPRSTGGVLVEFVGSGE
ncbi:methylmalonyl-CoA epimerase [Halorubrum halodurans]|uniref:Methylmalonyl-CoA epimerase n=1 Tax=Halorubrum halodurans TaxID=1383851 RepID=A0A256IJG9_9EURY|nr:methylmalonyl-CoA epimerase [Halorubrum halodurans]OYR56287.1 methylmalonyl-CoA epimerase [Halorubrum halodurans]